MQRAITAIYPTYAVATLVREELDQLGLARRHITVIPQADRGTTSADTATNGMAGTTVGTAGGGFVAAPPGGNADTAQAYTGADRAYGDAFDALHGLDLPEEDTRVYQQAIRNGDYIVSVQVDEDADLSRIQEVMRRPEEAYDLDELDSRYSSAEYVPRRETSGVGSTGSTDYGSTGLTGSMGGAGMAGRMDSSYTGEQELNEDGTVKVVEERLAVGKRDVDQGSLRVRSYVREEPVSAEVDLRATRVYVERHPTDRAVAPSDLSMRDQMIEAREHAEQAVVGKEARVVEEIGLRTDTEVEHRTVQDTVRKTEVEIEAPARATPRG